MVIENCVIMFLTKNGRTLNINHPSFIALLYSVCMCISLYNIIYKNKTVWDCLEHDVMVFSARDIQVPSVSSVVFVALFYGKI